MKSPTEILIICPFARPNIGGVESHLDKLINFATKQGFFITLITYQPLSSHLKGLPLESGPNYQIIRLNWFGTGWFNRLENYFPLVFLYLFPGLFLKSLFYYLRHHSQIGTIHAHGFIAGAISRMLTAIHPKNSIISTHAIYNFPNRPLLSFFIYRLLRGFNHVLAVSEVSRAEIIRLGLNPAQVSVHPNWIDTATFRLAPPPKINHQILFVGRLLPKKGTLLFLQAATKLPQLSFHLVGSGPCENEVIDYSSRFSNIIYHGSLNLSRPQEQQQLISLYQHSDFLLSPYLYDEGFSTTLIESLACGTPPIVSNRGSPPTFLSPKVAYFLPADPKSKDIVNLLNQVYAHPQQLINQRQLCRQYALRHFSPKNGFIITQHYQ
jgi:glycosyltransferase involved in cell wall biosynthesis